MNSWRERLTDLSARLAGPTFTPDTPAYDREVAVFNTVVQHRPALVVGATNADDVVEAVTFAAHHDLHVAVLNTGHGPSVPALSDTLLITTRRMSNIDIDVDNGCARVEAGVLFGQLVEATAVHGLAPLPGSSPGVGVVGYTLAGGASLAMGRKFGWAADHVSSIDVVTSDGRLRRVSAHSEADLFAALLGGKSNFGVVTAMEFTLFPVTRLYAGALFYSGEHIRGVLRAYRELTALAPDELSSGVAVLNLPPLSGLPPFLAGNLTVAVRLSYVGRADDGRRLIEPLRHAAPLLMDTVAEIPYTRFGSITADPTDPAAAVEHFGLLRELTEDAVEAIAEVADRHADTGINIVDIRHLGGALGKPAAFPNAIGSRNAAYAFFALTVVPPGHEVAAFRDAGGELITALRPWMLDAAHPSFLGPADATESGTRMAFDADVYRALRVAKSKYDPHNMFRTNHNVPPRRAA
jgi:FAD/FMN-containing dehydrogenase